MDAMIFGSFVKERRMMLGLTQAELAQRLHVTAKAVSRWERGVGFPDIHTLEPLAEALDVTVLELMQSREIREEAVSTDAANAAVTDTLTFVSAHKSAARSPVFWLAYLVCCAVMAFFIYILCKFVTVLWMRAVGVALVTVGSSLWMRGCKLLLERQLNPDEPVRSVSRRQAAALALSFLGALLLILSFPVRALWSRTACDIFRLLGFPLVVGSSLYLEFCRKETNL